MDDGERVRLHIAPAGPSPRKRDGRIELRHCRNILVVMLDFIGDWVLKTPFLANLRRNAPRAQITVVVLDRVYGLAETFPLVDRVISVARGEGRRIVLGAANLAELASFRRDYELGAFDLAVVPRWDADFNGALKIAHGSGATRIVGFPERSTPRKALLNRGEDRFLTDPVLDSRPAHEGERDFALIEAMGGTIAPVLPRVDITAEDRKAARLSVAEAFGKAGKPFLIVSPFASESKKTLPGEILAPVIRRLAERFGLSVIVLGGAGNAKEAVKVAALIGKNAVAATSLSIRQSAALIEMASVFIGMDSGPAHLAAATGTPTAVLFCHPADGDPGNTYSPLRFAPLGKAGWVLVLQPETALPPCRDGCSAREAHCVRQLTPEFLSPRLSAFVARFVKSGEVAQRSVIG